MEPVSRPIVRFFQLHLANTPDDYACFLSMWLSNAVFIDRNNRKDALATFSKAAQTMKDKKMSIFIFAEGTRSNTPQPTMLPFKKGAFHLAVQGQFPIIPIVMENYNSLYDGSRKRFEAGELVIRGAPQRKH